MVCSKYFYILCNRAIVSKNNAWWNIIGIKTTSISSITNCNINSFLNIALKVCEYIWPSFSAIFRTIKLLVFKGSSKYKLNKKFYYCVNLLNVPTNSFKITIGESCRIFLKMERFVKLTTFFLLKTFNAMTLAPTLLLRAN